MRILVKTTLIVLFVLCLSNPFIFASNVEKPKQVLLLFSYNFGMPWQQTTIDGIRSTFFASDSRIKTVLYAEYTGLTQTSDDLYVRKLQDLYRHKYANRKIDLVVSVGLASSNFMLRHGEEIFPGVPIVFASATTKDLEDITLKPDVTGVIEDVDIKGTLNAALKLQPDTRLIAVISGSSKADRFWEAKAREVFDRYEGGVKFAYLTGLTMDDLLKKVVDLPEHTIIFYVLTIEDGDGKSFIPRDVVARISAKADAPVYGLWATFLGYGIVGGDLSSSRVMGEKAARLGLAVLQGEKASNIPVIKGANAYMFDWRQLKRWGIKEKNLPGGSIVRYKEISFWELYKWRIIGVAALLVLEGVLILVLAIQVTRRRRAEQSLIKAHDKLEQRIEERTSELVQEIEVRKKAEEALSEGEAQKKAILDGITTNLTFVNENLEILWANKTAADSVNRTVEDMIGRKCYELWADPDSPCDDCPTAKAFKTKKTEQTIIHAPDGRVWEEKGEPVFDGKGRLIGVLEIAHDITARVRAKEALRESEEKYKTLLENLPQKVFHKDNTLTYVSCNENYTRDLKLNSEEISGKTDYDFYPKTLAEKYRADDKRIIASGKTEELQEEYEQNGQKFMVQTVKTPIIDDIGNVTGILGIFWDITEQLRAEEALLESEKKFRALFDTSPHAIALTEMETGKIIDVNDKFCEVTKNTKDEIVGKTTTELGFYSEDDRNRFINELRNSGKVDGLEMSFKAKDGSTLDTRMFAIPIQIEREEFLMTEFHDITEQKRLEDQLQQAHKMEVIGTLSGGIAHDYNNLLTVIMGNLSLAQEKTAPHSVMAGFLHDAELASFKARDLTDQFLTLSRGGHSVKKPGSIKHLLKEIFVQVQAQGGIECDLSIQDDLWPVAYDSKQLYYAISNVLMNAMEAMPQGGTVTIQAENKVIENKGEEFPLLLDEGKYVRISIGDEGKGIPEEHLKQIFDPYFSTKERGVQKGMGMGLTTAYAVVQKHGGHIMINSTTGLGTTVTIYLPAMGNAECGMRSAECDSAPAERKSTTLSEDKSEIQNPKSKIARVLVMDDEESLRNLAQKMLERLGHKVETVKDGAEAIETYKKHMDSGEPFDGVILDLTIKGGMGGVQAIKELIKIDPDVKAIVCSGYFNDPVLANYEEHGFRGAMAKPYQKSDLESVLKKVQG